MVIMNAWLLAWSAVAAATSPPHLQLSLLPSQPLLEQEVHLHITVTWPTWPSDGCELSAPWLSREPVAWTWPTPLDQLLCQQQAHATGRTVRVRLVGLIWRLPAMVQTDGSVKLALTLPLRFTDSEGTILLPPATLRMPEGATVTSNHVQVQPRRPGWAAAAPGQWRLGIGRFTVQTEAQAPRATLGESLDLTVCISGPDVATAPRPPLTQLQDLGPSHWRIETLPETWRGQQRCFRFRLWPVQPRPAQPLGLLRCQTYDPDLDREVDVNILLPTVAVVRPTPAQRPPSLNRAWSQREPLLEPEAAWVPAPTRAGWGIWTMAGVVTLFSLWTCAGRPDRGLWPRWLPRAWSRAARAAWAEFKSAADPATGCQALISAYLQQRTGWTVAQPTRAELNRKLSGAWPESLVRHTLDLWQQSDAARFGGQPISADWDRQAKRWLAAWESEP